MDGYKKVKILGSGTYGVVYLCARTRSERKIVLKEINIHVKKSGIKEAKNETKILKTLNHPNVIQYYKHYISPKFFCIVMEYANKGNLHDFIEKYREKPNNFVPQQTVLKIFSQIILAIDYLHKKRIIHRDLKSENILISSTKYNVIKVADFGISKMLDKYGEAKTIIGTPNYLAPEVCDGKPYNEKSDIWSLGCILYELCARERMFDGAMSNVVLSIVNRNIKNIDLNIYDEKIQEIIDATLTTNPEYRPSTNELIHHSILLSVIFTVLIELGSIP